MKFFLYCRKSTDREDRQILSTEAQERLLAEHAERNSLTVVHVYVEKQSAYKVGRPLFNEMLDRIGKGEANGILTYHLTRLARNSYDGGRLIYFMDEGLIRQIATVEKTYTNNSDDKFIMQIHFAMAKKSSDDTSQFVTRDIESKLLRGEYPGKVPIGYLNITRAGHISGMRSDPDKETLLRQLGRPLKREEIDPIDGPLVRKLFEAAATGAHSLPTLRTLSHALGLRGPFGGKKLSKNAIRNLLSNPYYHGAIAYRGSFYDTDCLRERTGNPEARIAHEPLVSRERFERVQAVVFAAKAKGRYRRHRFAFGACLMTCGACGAPITAEIQKGHTYYHCTDRTGSCSQRRWTREEHLDDQYSALLAGLRLPQGFVDYALMRLKTAHACEARAADVARRRLQGQINAAQQELDALLQLKLAPGNRDGEMLSDEDYLKRKRALRTEMDILEEQLKTVLGQGKSWVDDCETFFRFTQRVVRAFTEGALDDKKMLAHLICSNLTLKDRTLAAVYREPFAALAQIPIAGGKRKFPFEPRKVASESEKVLKSVSWLHLLTAIRTYALPEQARRIACL